ncbi:alpha/beta fold hydrolase [Ramlibacter alkalitolerans]|uniref:Alpha/beta fold hydrolase n=1 Tax=Ramlibacter alkalitolerans TaxID=2039631 RepID=A0ABS1JQ28_9BURK|nr:alpha/beta fold hydrolase [Ramlibacter alkalitolerans]MBL0426364.1 alpha/beta fold hydrolase [Ramlibacter alkalitolerans]
MSSFDQTALEGLEREAQRRRIAFADGQVSWRRFGSGPSMVLLHGGHGRWTHWARNIRAWAAHFTLWIPDLPGYGDSDKPLEPSMDALVTATLETLDAVVPRGMPLRLAGFSFGALVAAHLALRRGAIHQMVLLGPAGHGGARRPRGELRSWRELPKGGAAWTEAMRHNLAMHMFHDPANVDVQALAIHSQACERARFNSKPLSRAGGLGRCLQGYTGPLLLAWGEHDVTAHPSLAAAPLMEGRRHARACIVPNAGHWVQYESAERVNELVLSWLLSTDHEQS